MQNQSQIEWKDFQRIDFRVGTIISVNEFPEARKPAYIIHVDLGKEIDIKKSSAQVTSFYTPTQLIGKQVLCVCNFEPKQIGPILSEVLITGFPDEEGKVVLCVPEKNVANGTKLF